MWFHLDLTQSPTFLRSSPAPERVPPTVPHPTNVAVKIIITNGFINVIPQSMLSVDAKQQQSV